MADELSKNLTPKQNETRKSKFRLALMIMWMIAITAIFIFLILMFYNSAIYIISTSIIYLSFIALVFHLIVKRRPFLHIETKHQLYIHIAGISICSIMFIIIIVIMVKSFIDWDQFKTEMPNDQAYNNFIMLNVLNCILSLILYSSYILLAIQYLMRLARSLRVEHRSDIPPQ